MISAVKDLEGFFTTRRSGNFVTVKFKQTGCHFEIDMVIVDQQNAQRAGGFC